MFHGRIPYNILDLKLGIRPQKNPSPDSQIPQVVLQQTEMIFQDVRKNAMQAYIKYKAYYDKKADASKLKKQITFTSYKQRRFTKEANFLSEIFGGLELILLKRCYRAMNIWGAKLAPVRRKYFIE